MYVCGGVARSLLEQLVCPLVGQRYPRFVGFTLAVDAVHLAVLVLQLGAHVQRHVAQVADHGVHLAHVVLHLVFARVVCYPANVAGLWSYAIAFIHDPLGLVVDDFAVVVALPRAIVLLERCSLVTRQHADAAALLHAGQVLLRLAHVGVDLVHALLDAVQLLCAHTQAHAVPLALRATDETKAPIPFLNRDFKLSFSRFPNLNFYFLKFTSVNSQRILDKTGAQCKTFVWIRARFTS